MGRENEMNLTGFIQTKAGNVVFSAENFKFTVMKTDFSMENIVIPADEHGYIWGRTHEGRVIAIYVRNDIKVGSVCVFCTWNYIVFKGINRQVDSIASFRGIRFKNGAIKTVFPANALHLDKEEEDDVISYRVKPDCTEYHCEDEGQPVLWSFSSMIHQTWTIKDGDTLSNTDSLLDIMFQEEQNYSTFYKYYGYVCSLCSFLTFRRDVAFESVSLLADNPGCSREEYATCYIKNPDTVEQRDVMHVIPVRFLDETILKNIMKNIYDPDKTQKGLPLLITPEDERDANRMDIGKIRNICSAMEMELDMQGIRLPANPNMKKLVCAVKKMVKEHRGGENPLSEKSYDYIFSNISHWDQPLVERIWEAWKQHEKDLKPILRIYNIVISNEDIQEFVKARNNITHNGFTGISENVATTAFAIMILIYFCSMIRIGMKPQEAQGFLSRRLIG
jgi:hypothetical protein